jgi:ABC-type Na+ efflux pump permease subunit
MNKKVKEYITLRIINAIIIALITFFSSMTIQYPPTIQVLYASFIAFCLTLLIQLKGIIQELITQERPPKKEYRITTCSQEDKEDSKWNNLLVLL